MHTAIGCSKYECRSDGVVGMGSSMGGGELK